ncbi:hypothetical protein RB620_12680 [Paenibacillus sp. LHD-117]|uniref:hypothetical protein n=1 Tax=Paenibacillus sp. LHD-117 TaxID=3071412 RepID=UPI0027DF4E99|nr:hypothetical protein [Paenibacillus sp. LHD-117]MDQ6420291.1 hypothetical protein [Paenibacillus sp. LHD-117]
MLQECSATRNNHSRPSPIAQKTRPVRLTFQLRHISDTFHSFIQSRLISFIAYRLFTYNHKCATIQESEITVAGKISKHKREEHAIRPDHRGYGSRVIFFGEQKQDADARRLEMLERDLLGTKRMFSEVLWPVFSTLDGFQLEHRIVGGSGVSMYIDAFYEPLGLAFESEGFAFHAENITRERFSFERAKIRAMLKNGYVYVPFTMDEIDKKPEACRSSLYEILRYWGGRQPSEEITLHERELLRYVSRLGRPFKLADVETCLRMKRTFCLNLIKGLAAKKLIKPLHPSRKRNHYYELEKDSNKYL